MENISFYEKDLLSDWTVSKSQFVASDEANDETIFTLSNGYMGIRGALELDGLYKSEGTYIAGLFDKVEVESNIKRDRGYVKNKAITPAYAIVPDCNLIELSANGVSFDFINCKIHKFERNLDMKRGILFNEYIIENPEGNILNIKTMSIVSKANVHLAFYKYEITPVNFSGEVSIAFKNIICLNPQPIRRLKDYVCKTDLLSAEELDGICNLRAEISETKDQVLIMSKTNGEGKRFVLRSKNGIKEAFKIDAKQEKVYSFSRQVLYYTTHDSIDEAKFFEQSEEDIISAHCRFWDGAWDSADIEIEGDDDIQLGLRWNLYSLIQVANSFNPDVSISATALHGQGYFGHAFWDTEIFLVPYYIATDPATAKNLLIYRYKRLDFARKIATEEGCIGAKFPWTSAYTGADVTPPDWAASSKREIHINGAIAYAMYNYYIQTNDYSFYKNYGIETIIETAKYYASRATLGNDEKYHILDVTGPDEYNIHVDDNYYTNYLAVWNIKEALSAMQKLRRDDVACYSRIARTTNFNEETISYLNEISNNMVKPRVKDYVVEQFDGFFNLKDTGGFPRDKDGMPIDRKRVFDSGLQELKQPDVVMLHYLFPNDFSEEEQKACFEYYEKRCKHGSSLSPSIHCVVGLRNGFNEHAYSYLYLTTLLDLKNLHLDKNLYEGAHIACASGTWAATVYGFGGLQIRGGDLHINPIMPEKWTKLSYKFFNKGVIYSVNVTKDKCFIQANKNGVIYVKNKKYNLIANKESVFEI